MDELEYQKSQEEYQDQIYHRQYNAEADIKATQDMILDLENEIKTKELILDQLKAQLTEDQKSFAEEFAM